MRELNGDVETPEPGFLTVEDWAEKTGRSRSQTSKYLSAFAREGRAECRKFRIHRGDKVYPVPHYRIRS